jgi:transcriptional regulator with XRE-family HTH domain
MTVISIGELLRHHRRQAGLTLKQLGGLIHYDFGKISEWELSS